MNPHHDVVKNVLESEEGPHIGAFFDFDGTIIAGYSVYPFVQKQLRAGLLSANDIVELLLASINHKLGVITFNEVLEITGAIFRDASEESFRDFGEEVYRETVASMVYPESRALVHAHLSKGHTVAIVSSATPYQVRPALLDLQIQHLACTQLAVSDGRFTGAISGEPCFGIGKVHAVDRLAKAHKLDIAKSFFYSDSDDDLEALEHVGRPRVMNPNSALRSIAERRGWSIRQFSSRGPVGIPGFIRSMLAYTSLLTTTLSGAAMWLLTGSKQEGRNFAISMFGDIATALVGMKMNVRGEEHLWRSKPAVIIFNHQSNADGLVLFKLLRRDAAAVGKKELSEMPVAGQILDFLGMVPIDRSNRDAAIKAIAPLADIMHKERRNIVIAPEGTRSHSTVPGPFKKGAFRIAMQAKVPIIPIVIHNSSDVQPKGERLFRPATVEVDVLEPIDVSDWELNELQDRIDAVRALFMEKLGLQNDSAAESTRKSASVVALKQGVRDESA